MNIKAKLEKQITLMTTNEDTTKIPESLTSIETYQKMTEKDELVALTPKESNLQLPNIFLRTKKVPECEKFLKNNGSVKNFNENVDFLVGVLENTEIFENEVEVVSVVEEIDNEFVMKNIKERF